MIILKCSKCHEQLEVDDAFAGGICRCVHCGALSHVPHQPTQTDKKGRPLTPPEMARPVVVAPEEQEHLVIAQAREHVAEQKRRGLLAIIMMLMALAMAAAAILLVVKYYKQANAPVVEGEAGTALAIEDFTKASGPNMAGVPLTGQTVAYAINTGGSMREIMDAARQAVLLSSRTLGDRKMVVLGWARPASDWMGQPSPAEPPPVWPAEGTVSADQANRDELADWVQELAAVGSKAPGPAVGAALDRGAGTIVLVTHFDLEPAESADLAGRLKDKGVQVVALVVGDGGAADYPELAKVTPAGQIKVMTEEEIRLALEEALSGSQQ